MINKRLVGGIPPVDHIKIKNLKLKWVSSLNSSNLKLTIEGS